ncbi:MAG TPA: NAD(P)-dependent oxidoreductase [Candidatus Acidoferrales bacterium]|nr:NAD(P)-dependent oxidoreductase [Candidatus Acidoferrales bacterium]
MSEHTIGFVGVGRMGARMAARLIKAGYALTIYDTNPAAMKPLVEQGAATADSPAAVASSAQVVLASVPTPPIVQAVALGPAGVVEGKAIKIFIDVSTTGATVAKTVAGALAAKGIVAVDAPVSGGIAGAEKGTLAVMLSCPEKMLPIVRPILEVLGKIFVVGTQPGQGQTMKLLNNLLSASAMAITSEAMALGVKAGLDPSLIVDVFNAGTARNSATQDKIKQHVISRSFSYGFGIGLLSKDIRLCMAEADALGVPMVVGSAVRQLLSIAAVTEGPDADMTAMARTVEQWAGVEIGQARSV